MSDIKQVLLSERPNATAAPQGLGNYKGVMLCNRPDAVLSVKLGPPPFNSTVSETYNQPLGLNPVKSQEEEDERVSRPTQVSQAMKKHAEWLKKLQEEMKISKEAAAKERTAESDKLDRVKKMAERQREGVRKMIQERAKEINDRHQFEKELAQAVRAPDMTKVPVEKKPMWAMTGGEKEEFDLMEADQLIDFANDLDFDKYIFDLEFREQLEALKNRSKSIDDEQKLFQQDLVAALNAEEDDATSRADHDGAGAVKEKIAKAQSDWDASTTVGEKREEDAEVRNAAQQVLATHSDIRAVHSEASVKKIIEKQKQKVKVGGDNDSVSDTVSSGLKADLQYVTQNCSIPNPVIVNHEGPSIKKKEMDPSMLPYLYRSPAI